MERTESSHAFEGGEAPPAKLKKCRSMSTYYDSPLVKRLNMSGPALTFNRIGVVEGVTNYLQSKREAERCRAGVYSTINVIDGFQSCSTAAQKLQAQTHLIECEESLKSKRLTYEKVAQENKETLKSLDESLRALGVLFKKYDAFVAENNDKRVRAVTKINDGLKFQKKLKEEIAEMKESIAKLATIKRKIEERIKNYRLYEDYLNSFVRKYHADNYHDIDDVIRKYEALLLAKEIIMKKEQNIMMDCEVARSDCEKLIESKELKLKIFKVQLERLLNRYKSSREKSLHFELIVAGVIEAATNMRTKYEGIKESIRSLYLYACKRRHVEPEFKLEEHEKQLEFIKNYLQHIHKVTTKSGGDNVLLKRAVTRMF